MSDTNSLDFLQIDFDPASLTVPRLRSILVNYNVSYPSTAKKAQLVNIFIDEILPLKSSILKERDLVRRSSRGILNAASPEIPQAESNIASKSRVSRKNTRKTNTKVEVEEESEEGINHRKKRAQSPTKKTPRVSSKHARSSDNEAGLDLDTRRKSLRKRNSEIPTYFQPALSNVKHNDDLSDLPSTEKVNRRESAFSYDNPFQSGSSPPSGKKPEKGWKGLSASRERRKTTGYSTRLRREPSRTFDGAHPPSSKTFEYPATPTSLKEINVIKSSDENVIEPGEEFTPEEQVELAIERAKKGDEAFHSHEHKPKSTNSLNLRAPFWIVTFTVLISYFFWYREEKIAVGYCGVGREAIPLISPTWDLPGWARILVEPECEPCPHHAFCYDRMEIDCERDFLLKPHPLSLARLFPLAPTCEPDGKKVRKARIVADRAVEELRERRVKYECGASNNEAGNVKPTADIDADNLKREVSKKRQKVITEAEFDEIWTVALDDVKSRHEVQSVTDGIHTRLSSTSLASLPLSCALRRFLRQTLAEHRFQIGSLILIVLSLFYTRSVIISRRKTNDVLPRLISLTLERLINQATLHHEDNNIERWISIGQLRDDILRDEHSIAKRERLWLKVRIVIETNANVRSSQKEDRNGEVSRVWEWIGAVGSRPGPSF